MTASDFLELNTVEATADRIGHEIYSLQRPEIGEVCEGFVPGTVGSITMPQKRNPEIALARVVRYQAAYMGENLVHDIAGIESLFDVGQSTGCCAQMVDHVLAEAEARSREGDEGVRVRGDEVG